MIIGIDASRANSFLKTGTEWYSYHLIEEFKHIIPQEHEVRLYSREKLRGPLAELPGNWRSKVLRPSLGFWTQVRLRIEMKLCPPDVLFVPAHVLPLTAPQDSFITIHDAGFARFPQMYSRAARMYHRFAVKFALSRAKKIFVPSEFTRKELIRVFNAPSDKLVVTPLGYDKERYRLINEQTKIDEVLTKYRISAPFFMSIGRLEKKKNTQNIVKAFHLYLQKSSVFPEKKQNYNLVLAGPPGDDFKNIVAVIRKLGLEKRIILPGWINKSDIPPLLNAARIFIFPSNYEGFGIPILEAMACGTTVITSARASMPEVARDAALLIDPSRPEDIAKAMHRLTENPSLFNQLREKGLERVKNFSWERCARMTLEEMIGNRGKSPPL